MDSGASSLGNGVEDMRGNEAWNGRLLDLRNEHHEVSVIRCTCGTPQHSDDSFHKVEDMAVVGKLHMAERILFAVR